MSHEFRISSGVVKVALVGVGGTGSEVLRGLAKMAMALPHIDSDYSLQVTVYDDDVVTPANVGRQPFTMQDVGESKADLLVSRYNVWFGLDFQSCPERIGERSRLTQDIIITCVDSAAARRAVGNAISPEYHRAAYWLDCGNQDRTGQVVLGQPVRHHHDFYGRLPTVLELYPELNDPTRPEDDAPSCSMAEALRKQDLFINTTVAMKACEMLWRMFKDGEIQYCAAWMNLLTGTTRTLAVDPEVWKRFGHKGARKPRTRKKQPA